jgi:hypothetical protein
MASSKNKLTEEQLTEGLFGKILTSIIKGRTKKVLHIVSDLPDIKRAVKDADAAHEKLKRAISRADANAKKRMKM